MEAHNKFVLGFILVVCSLFGTLMMLKAACINNACYIDRYLLFMQIQDVQKNIFSKLKILNE